MLQATREGGEGKQDKGIEVYLEKSLYRFSSTVCCEEAQDGREAREGKRLDDK